MMIHVKMKMLKWLYLLENTRSLLSNVTNEWEDEILEETDFVMILQETTKSLAMVVSGPNI